ncbi:hypothetical protein BDZ91DRAFT_799366 [Kalaharituber pfeilii]|nr:hypothetical protein BDZ91DRAFT_799366 [Kalaharituber pfeilii]
MSRIVPIPSQSKEYEKSKFNSLAMSASPAATSDIIPLGLALAHQLLTPARLNHPDLLNLALNNIYLGSGRGLLWQPLLVAIAESTPCVDTLAVMAHLGREELSSLAVVAMLGLEAFRSWGGGGFHGVKDSDSRPQSAGSGSSTSSAKRTAAPDAVADANEDGQSVADEHPADAQDEQSPTLPWLAPLYNAFSISSPLPPLLLAAAGGAAPRIDHTPSGLSALLVARQGVCALSAATSPLDNAHIIPYSLLYGPRRIEGYAWQFLAFFLSESVRDIIFNIASGAQQAGDGSFVWPDAVDMCERLLPNGILINPTLHTMFDKGQLQLLPVCQLPVPASDEERHAYGVYYYDVEAMLVGDSASEVMKHHMLRSGKAPESIPPAIASAASTRIYLHTMWPDLPAEQVSLSMPDTIETGSEAVPISLERSLTEVHAFDDGSRFRLHTPAPGQLALPAAALLAVRVLVWRLLDSVGMDTPLREALMLPSRSPLVNPGRSEPTLPTTPGTTSSGVSDRLVHPSANGALPHAASGLHRGSVIADSTYGSLNGSRVVSSDHTHHSAIEGTDVLPRAEPPTHPDFGTVITMPSGCIPSCEDPDNDTSLASALNHLPLPAFYDLLLHLLLDAPGAWPAPKQITLMQHDEAILQRVREHCGWDVYIREAREGLNIDAAATWDMESYHENDGWDEYEDAR